MQNPVRYNVASCSTYPWCSHQRCHGMKIMNGPRRPRHWFHKLISGTYFVFVWIWCQWDSLICSGIPCQRGRYCLILYKSHAKMYKIWRTLLLASHMVVHILANILMEDHNLKSITPSGNCSKIIHMTHTGQLQGYQNYTVNAILHILWLPKSRNPETGNIWCILHIIINRMAQNKTFNIHIYGQPWENHWH